MRLSATASLFRARRTLVGGLCLLAGCAAEEPPYALRRVAVDPFGGGDAAISPEGTRFVTSSRRGGSWDLWLFDLPSGEWTNLTGDDFDNFEAQWSPDGERLAFTSTRGGGKNVWVLTLADGSLRQLTDSDHDEEYPSWSPDGESIVFTGGPWQGRSFFVVPAAGGEPRDVTGAPGHEGACSFVPTGGALVCHTYASGTGSVVEWPLDGGVPVPVTGGPAWDYKPSVSPDGAWVAFSRSMEGPSRVWLLPRNGGGAARPLVETAHDDRWPTWSRAAGSLLFHRLVDEGTAVRLLDRETGEVREVAGAREHPLQASLHPSGDRVAYCAMEGARHGLRVADLGTGRVERLTTGFDEACFPRWSPDGARLAFVARARDGRWRVATARADGRGAAALTPEGDAFRGVYGPLDWAPDGTRLVFKAETAPFESDLFVAEVATGEIWKLTDDPWWDEAPAWTPDGQGVVFMSTRGGEWTWGLWRISLSDRRVELLAGPDYVEKNLVRPGPGGWLVWSEYGSDGVERLVERAPDGAPSVRADAGPWSRWPSYSADGRHLLYTSVGRRVEYWLAENLYGRGSPLLHAAGEEAPLACEALPATAALGTAGMRSPAVLSSPKSLHHR
jgi:TolB protein